MNATTIKSHFCEKKIIGNPEYFSSFSSLIISFIPYISLKYSQLNTIFAVNILQILFITGLTSFGYHWTGWYIFKQLDEIPMIIAIWLGLLYFITNLKSSLNNIYFFVINLYFIIFLSLNTIEYFQFLFPYLFSIVMLVMIPCLIKIYRKKYSYSNLIPIKLSIIGSIIIILSGLIWFITELNCNKYLILAHSLWHFGIIYGVYNIIISMECFEYFKKGIDIKIDYKYRIIPIISLQERLKNQ